MLLFTLGINNGIRTGDLRKLKISHVKNASRGKPSNSENPIGKANALYINREVYKAPQRAFGGI